MNLAFHLKIEEIENTVRPAPPFGGRGVDGPQHTFNKLQCWSPRNLPLRQEAHKRTQNSETREPVRKNHSEHFVSLAQGRSVRSPNVHWTFAPCGVRELIPSNPQNLKPSLLFH